LNSIGFLLAAIGAGLIATELSASLFHTGALADWMGPVPAALFVGTTLALTISALIATKGGKAKKVKAAMPFMLQMLGASFLVIGGFQSHGLSNILPNGGQPLHDLNISITSFATIAGVAALATLYFGYKSFTEKNSEIMDQLNKNEIISDDKNNEQHSLLND